MLEVLKEEIIVEVLTHPEEYVTDSVDIVLVRIDDTTDIDNPIYIMVGKDDDGKYYLVAEDSDISIDYYPEDEETLLELYIKILEIIAETNNLI